MHDVDHFCDQVVLAANLLLEVSLWQFSVVNKVAWVAQLHQTLVTDFNDWAPHNLGDERRGIAATVQQR